MVEESISKTFLVAIVIIIFTLTFLISIGIVTRQKFFDLNTLAPITSTVGEAFSNLMKNTAAGLGGFP